MLRARLRRLKTPASCIEVSGILNASGGGGATLIPWLPQIMRYVRVKCFKCGTEFEKSVKEFNRSSRLGRKSFCSLSCASQHGNSQQYIDKVSKALKVREAWRYKSLADRLSAVPHEFECGFGGFIYDLFLPTVSTLVEFDEPGVHCGKRQRRNDHLKDLVARLFGYTVVHIPVESSEVIPHTALGLLLVHSERMNVKT